MNLIEYWETLIPLAETRKEERFVFYFEGRNYFSEMVRGKWSEPIQIKVF